ncbi:MAG: DUF3263 domain-containing protein [Rhodococcus sp. (in: high G+C Gram-positive bacteria)]|nr:MAG: DUF3263 domain-containing protein [Rhodococcus sp. (in: high G+C Gram-positive bacteria)]
MSSFQTTTRLSEAIELVTFAARWHPYGGPEDEEILIYFGLTPDRYHLRLGHLLDFYDSTTLGLSRDLHRALRRHCCEQVD